MTVLGYEHEGIAIPKEDAIKYIWKQVRYHDEDKEDVFEYLWDAVVDNPEECEKFKEWFFDGVCADVECDDEYRVKGCFGE